MGENHDQSSDNLNLIDFDNNSYFMNETFREKKVEISAINKPVGNQIQIVKENSGCISI